MTSLPDVGSAAAVSEGEAPVLVVPMGADLAPGPGVQYVLDRLGSWVDEHLEGVGFSGKPGEVAVVPTAGGIGYNWIVMVGVGDDPDHETVRRAAGTGFRAAPRARRLVTTLHQLSVPGALAATVDGSLLAGYRYEDYRSEPSDRPVPEVGLAAPLPSDWMDTAERCRVVAEAVNAARDWVNQPPQDQGPADLAALMSAMATEAGMTVEIWDEKKLVEEGMGGIMSVGRGSHRPPRLVRLIGPGRGPRLTLAGKGITFDSGGLSLKPAKNQELMKFDMSGAAAVAAAGVAISRLGLGVRVEVLAALAENMPGGGASRPGDVFRARNGKTVEVVNTDAEGRLVLADALSLGAEGSPDLLVDVATLTGATAVAVGLRYAGLYGSEDARKMVAEAAEAAGEKVWPLPLPEEYRRLLDSPVADMKNTGGRWGGGITAALVLKEFTADVPWAHLDIPGPAKTKNARHYLSAGATGFGVRTLVELASRMAGG